MTRLLLTLAVDERSSVPLEEVPSVLTLLLDGSRVIATSTIEHGARGLFEWEGGVDLPLGAADAHRLMDEDGFLTVVLTVDQHEYMSRYAYGEQTPFADDEADLVHSLAFAAGVAHDPTLAIIGVQDDRFLVSYTTNVREGIQPEETEIAS